MEENFEVCDRGNGKASNVVALVEDTEQFSGQAYLLGVTPTRLSPGKVKALNASKSAMKEVRKRGVDFAALVLDVIKPEIKMRMINPDEFQNTSLLLLARVTFELLSATETLKLEKHFRSLFDDMKGSLHDWRLFTSVENGQHALVEKICVAFCNLAITYRRRAWYALCEEVMSIFKEALDSHTEMIRRRMAAQLSDDDEVLNHRDMINKYYLIAINLALNLKRPAGVPAIYRSLMQFKIDMGIINTEHEQFAWMIASFHGQPLTTAGLAATTDEQLVQCFLTVLSHAPPDNPADFESKEKCKEMFPSERWRGGVQLAVCAGCGCTEPFLSTYKACGRCKVVKYCGKECQVSHYKAHKAACKQIIRK